MDDLTLYPLKGPCGEVSGGWGVEVAPDASEMALYEASFAGEGEGLALDA